MQRADLSCMWTFPVGDSVPILGVVQGSTVFTSNPPLEEKNACLKTQKIISHWPWYILTHPCTSYSDKQD